MSERDNILLRWARLKQAVKTAQETDAAATETGGTVAPPAASGRDEESFDLESLPPIESITAETDIIAFLRAGVPGDLTRAALRRAWTSDPAIRDFIGIAENQWDFNDPDAIPGFGPLASSDISADVLAQISGRLERIPKPFPDIAPPDEPRRSDADRSGQLDDQRAARSDQDRADAATLSNDMQEVGAEGESGPVTEPARKRRRHGSALPH